MEVRKGKKWYKVLKRFGNKILIEKTSVFTHPIKEWVAIGDFSEVK